MPPRAKSTRKAVAGKRYPLNMRTTFDIRKHLEDAAKASGFSLAQEAERRIEQSFREDKTHAETLQYYVDQRNKMQDQLHEAQDRINELETLQLNIGVAIETAITNAFAKAGFAPKDDQQ